MIPILKRSAIYFFGFALPPLFATVLFTLSSVSQVMIHRNPKAVEGPPPPARATGTQSTSHDPGKSSKPLNAVILLSNAGTEITDLLGPYEILSASGLFHVVTAAPSKQLSPTNSAAAVFPHVSLEEAPTPDLIVIPAVMDPTNQAFVDWLHKNAPKARQILVLCEGARLAAHTGLLDGRNATSHFISLDELRKLYTKTHWFSSVRYVSDGNVITSAGVTASLDATLFAIEKMAGLRAANRTAAELGYAWNRQADPSGLSAGEFHPRMEPKDYLRLLLSGGYDWFKRGVGVLMYPGMSELSLAAILDSFPRTLSTRVFTFAPTRTWIPTRHGLTLVPSVGLPEVGSVDLILIPSGRTARNEPPPLDPTHSDEIRQWLIQKGVSVKSFLFESPGKAFPQALHALSLLEGPPMAQLVSKLIEFPPPRPSGTDATLAHMPSSWPFALWIRPLGIGLLGLSLAMYLVKLLSRKRKVQSAP